MADIAQVKHGEQVREDILKAIIRYIEKRGYPPTFREIGDMVGLKTTSSVMDHMIRMRASGMIETGAECSPRAIRVPGYRFVKEELEKAPT